MRSAKYAFCQKLFRIKPATGLSSNEIFSYDYGKNEE